MSFQTVDIRNRNTSDISNNTGIYSLTNTKFSVEYFVMKNENRESTAVTLYTIWFII
jgi:hypothetical protein